MTEYWYFWKKYRKFRIVIFPEMGEAIFRGVGEILRLRGKADLGFQILCLF